MSRNHHELQKNAKHLTKVSEKIQNHGGHNSVFWDERLKLDSIHEYQKIAAEPKKKRGEKKNKR